MGKIGYLLCPNWQRACGYDSCFRGLDSVLGHILVRSNLNLWHRYSTLVAVRVWRKEWDGGRKNGRGAVLSREWYRTGKYLLSTRTGTLSIIYSMTLNPFLRDLEEDLLGKILADCFVDSGVAVVRWCGRLV